MDGPSFQCAYLGFSAISKPPTSLGVLQEPIRDLYFQYRKTPATGRSVNLKLVQKGILVTLYENGSISAELFFDFASVTFVEAAKFIQVKLSDRKLKAVFVPIDSDSKAHANDKNAFLVEKSFQFLISSSHPPLLVCVVRRPSGVKALDLHVFALDTIENAIHISAFIASVQMSSGQAVKSNASGEAARAKSGFDRGVRGDVIRTDRGEYSVYRGPAQYDQSQFVRYSGGIVPDLHPDQRYIGGPVQAPGRNLNLVHPEGGPIILTQDNFRGPPLQTHPFYNGPAVTKGYIPYEQSSYGNQQPSGYPKPPDVIMHANQWPGYSAVQHPQDRLNPDPSFNAVRVRSEEVQMRTNNSNNRMSAVPSDFITSPVQVQDNRLSKNIVSPSSINPRPADISPMYTAGQHHIDSVQSPISPKGAIVTSKSHHSLSPTSPGFDEGGPVFSASNLESRALGGQPESSGRNSSGKPIAKVPPHMKGIKVLPSDFRMVKLKSKNDKRPDTTDDDECYDNDKEISEKYKELQEKERDLDSVGRIKQPTSKSNNADDADGFKDFNEQNKIRVDERNKNFQLQWNETISENKLAEMGYSVQGSNYHTEPHHQGGYRNYEQRRDNDGGDKWHQKSHPLYTTDGKKDPKSSSRTKELEIANMFSNVNLQSGGNKRVSYRQPGDRTEIEEGLGYLP